MNSQKTIYLIGSGIASLASAVYLIKDCNIPGSSINIIEQDNITGGCMDGAGDSEKGFVARGGRMHESNYLCFWDLLSNIPSETDPSKSLTDEIFEFNNKYVSNAQSRLLQDAKIVDVSSFGLSAKNRSRIFKLSFSSEKSLGNKTIEDWFPDDFFDTKFWLIWTTMFAFQKWSSLAEMRRYFKRFMHLTPELQKFGGIMRTKYNQYDSVILPVKKWLKAKEVNFRMNTQVLDIDFDLSDSQKTAIAIHLANDGKQEKISLKKNDYVFITNGSIVESTDIGSMTTVPVTKSKESSGSWMLWEKISQKDDTFGNPGVFSNQIDLQKWESFTITFKDPEFFRHMADTYDYIPGISGLVTIKDSNWLLSIVLPAQPHFVDQNPEDQVLWGYALYSHTEGDFVKKKVSECTGEEILTELFTHLKVTDKMKPGLDAGKINCLPVMMPFADSLFMPRKSGDRPQVIPKGATNFAFLGQFSEIPYDCVFTVEYSVRSALTAVSRYFKSKRKIKPVYIGGRKISSMIKALKTLKR